MSPLMIEILLHYHCRADEYRNGDHSAPAVKEAFGFFLTEDMLKSSAFCIERFDDGTVRSRYEVTPRGKAYIDALLSIPLPVMTWTIPPSARMTAREGS